MKLLISNDDGVHAPGLGALVARLKQMDNLTSIDVIAPDRNLSGASSALTLSRPLYPHRHSNDFISIDGTPADCVHLGITGMLDYLPDRVISGINFGANLGDDVLYSGTVAAALEGRFLDRIPLAISLAGDTHFATAAEVTCTLLTTLDRLNLPANTIVNVNVPDLEYSQLRGYKITRLGYRKKANPCHRVKTPRGQDCCWIADAGEPADAVADTDFYAIHHGYVSITPVHIDLTRHDSISRMNDWLQEHM